MIKKLLNSGIFWTIIVGVIGIGLTILFFKYTNKEREPVYAIKRAPSIIFDKENSSPKIKLLSADSVIINESVYITNFVIWNNGELEISKKDLRKDFKLIVPKGFEILDYKITNHTHPDISNFRLVQKGDELIIDWDYFDPGFGFELQLIYSGNENSHIELDGYVLGKSIKKVLPTPPLSSGYGEIMIFILGLIIFFSYLAHFNSPLSRMTENRSHNLAFLIFVGLSILVFGFLIYKKFFTGFELPI